MTQSSKDASADPSSDKFGQDLSTSIPTHENASTPHGEADEVSEIQKIDSLKSTFWKGMIEQANHTAKTVGGAAQGIVKKTSETTTHATQKLSETTQGMVQVTTETAAATASRMTQTSKAIAQVTTKTGKTVVSSIGSGASSIGNSISEGASQAGKAIAHGLSETHNGGKAIATSINQGISTGSSQASKMVVNTVSHATSSAGQVMAWIHEHTHLQHLTRAIKVDWLVGIIDTVNVDAVETRIQQLKQKHASATPYQLAGRIMAKKSLIVGGSGLASSILPGAAAAMVAFDLATTTAIQAEMGYEIAAAYGLDVHDPARKGEILAIFGLALGSSQALKTGFQYLARNVPVAGAVVGASTNAVALYAVGHAACQFYEAKLNETTHHVLHGSSPALLESTTAESVEAELEAELEAVKTQQQNYFEAAIAQQILMDQIFAHILKAGHPDKPWPQLLCLLEDLHFNPVSIQLISQSLDNPPDFDLLLKQVNPEFAVPLVAQCQALVNSDPSQTSEEKRLLEIISQKFLPSNP